MIKKAESDEKKFIEILRNNPVNGVRIETMYECYKEYPSLCGCYLIGENAALSVTGKAALLAGEVEDKEEFSDFLLFLGINEIESMNLKLPKFKEESFEVLRFTGSEKYVDEQFDMKKEPPPVEVWSILNEAGASISKDNFYADFCMRKNRNMAKAYALKEKGKYVSTSGVYSMNDEEAYMSFVATLPHYRKKGYASALCTCLAKDLGDRTIYIACEKELSNLYIKAGFVLFAKMVRLTRKDKV